MHRILTRSARRIIFQPSNSLSKFAKLDRSAAVVPACRWRWAAPEFHMSTSCSSRHLMNESGDKYSGQSFSQQCSLSHWLAMAFPGAQRWDLHISPSLLCFQPNQKSGPSFLRIIESKPCEVMRTKLLSYWAVANVTATSCPIPGSSCKANVKLQIFCEKKLISTNLKPSVSAQTSSCPSVIHSVRQAGQFLSRVWHIHSNNNQATCKIQADLGKKTHTIVQTVQQLGHGCSDPLQSANCALGHTWAKILHKLVPPTDKSRFPVCLPTIKNFHPGLIMLQNALHNHNESIACGTKSAICSGLSHDLGTPQTEEMKWFVMSHVYFNLSFHMNCIITWCRSGKPKLLQWKPNKRQESLRPSSASTWSISPVKISRTPPPAESR